MTYVDGFVAAVETSRKAEYLDVAKISAKVFKEYGAVSVCENWGHDIPDGKLTSFPLAVKCKPTETVVFSWVTWRSKQERDAGWEKIMADPRMQPDQMEMPFDGKRLIFGGFDTILDA